MIVALFLMLLAEATNSSVLTVSAAQTGDGLTFAMIIVFAFPPSESCGEGQRERE